MVVGVPPDRALASGLLVVTLVNAVGGVLAQHWLGWVMALALLLGAVPNLYFLVILSGAPGRSLGKELCGGSPSACWGSSKRRAGESLSAVQP